MRCNSYEYNRRKKIIAIYLWMKMKRRQNKHQRNRIHWVHPILRDRLSSGMFATLYPKLRDNPLKFYNYFRMSTESFDYLVSKLHPIIKKQDTHMRFSVSVHERLAITLRYLASGMTFTDLHYWHRLGISTISYIVYETCLGLWKILKSEVFPNLSTESWKKIAKEFNRNAHFPNCIGAIDGKHIRVFRFPRSGSMNFNYKHYFSIVLMAVVDSNYEFIYVDVGAYGKDCDSSVFESSSFWKLLIRNKLDIPSPAPIKDSSDENYPFVFVADAAFALNQFILRPFGGHHLDKGKRVFNYRLTRARRYVECAFGILANKWRIFHRPLNVSKPFAKNLVKAAVVLHNFLRQKEPNEQLYVNDGMENLPVNSKPSKKKGDIVRAKFAKFFCSSQGALPWQESRI